MNPWRPDLSATSGGPLYLRLLEALSADISSGALAPGARLPPQRELAHALSISVGAVTRAYDEAALRGLVAGQVGRGTFVVDRSAALADDEPVDLTLNIAPGLSQEATAAALTALRRTVSWSDRLGYQPVCGQDVDRRAASAWLERSAGLERADWRRLLCCAGAQNAVAIALAALCRPGDAVLCEPLTFPGVKTVAVQQGYRLHGLAMDAEGLRPDALDAAAATTGARVLYALPTLQNPTARNMSARRRAQIVEIARRRDLWIVEDDVYAPYAGGLGLPPLASLAPERTFYASSLSKILWPGLRAGFLLTPDGEMFNRCVKAMRAFMHSPAGVGTAITTELIESERADDLAGAVLAETRARLALALEALDGFAERPVGDASLHLWIPTAALAAERIVAQASSLGVRLNSPEAFAVPAGDGGSGLRLCLGAAASPARLRHALSAVRDLLSGTGPEAAEISV